MKLAFDLNREEWKRFGLLACCFFAVIGSYWMLRVVKNALFMEMVGHRSLPYAKIVSIINLVILLLIYNRLVDWLGRLRLIRWLFGFYVIVFLSLAAVLAHPTFGLGNTAGNGLIGWVLYVTIEGYGSLGVLLLWSYVISITDDEQAKRAFPLLAAAGNFGAVIGTGFVFLYVTTMGTKPLLPIAAFVIGTVPLTIEYFVRHFGGAFKASGPAVPLSTAHDRNRTGGVLEGLSLLAKRPYLLAILAIVLSYEMTGAFFDYQMNASSNETLVEMNKVTRFLALYGVSQSMLSLTFAAIGTTNLLRWVGVTPCLIAFPVFLMALNAYIRFNPGMWSFFIAMVGLKGLSYSMNKPCLEILYVPTNRAVQFKAKSWIDTAGSRSGKMIGSVINAAFPYEELLRRGGIVFFGVLAAWIPVARWAGRKNRQLVEAGEVIH